MLADGDALYLDQVAGSSSLQSHNWVGQHIPLHATSNGKVLLSGLDDAEFSEVVSRLARYTPRTITAKAALREEVARVREAGYAVAVDELEVGLTAVAAPIRSAHGDVVASLSVSGPTFRLHDDALGERGAPAGRRRRGGLAPARLGPPLRLPLRGARGGILTAPGPRRTIRVLRDTH